MTPELTLLIVYEPLVKSSKRPTTQNSCSLDCESIARSQKTDWHILKCILFLSRKLPSVEEKHKDQKAVASKEFQAGRDLIEDEFAEENRVKVEIYVYYAKSIGMLMAVMAVIFYVSLLKLISHTLIFLLYDLVL